MFGGAQVAVAEALLVKGKGQGLNLGCQGCWGGQGGRQRSGWQGIKQMQVCEQWGLHVEAIVRGWRVHLGCTAKQGCSPDWAPMRLCVFRPTLCIALAITVCDAQPCGPRWYPAAAAGELVGDRVAD